MKAAPLVAAHEEGLEPVEGDEEARQAEGLLGASEQEMLLTAQRGRQGFSTGPVQFGSQEQTFSLYGSILYTPELSHFIDSTTFLQLGFFLQ